MASSSSAVDVKANGEAKSEQEEQHVAEKSKSLQDEKQDVDASSGTSCSASISQGEPSTSASHAQPSTSARNDSGVPPPFANLPYPWPFDFSAMKSNPDFTPFTGFRVDQAGNLPPMVPIVFPGPLPLLFPAHSQEEEQRQSGGIFAVPLVPIIGPVAALSPGGLIPFSYNLPQSTPVSSMQGVSSTASGHSDRAMPPAAQEGPPAGLHHRVPAAVRAGQVQRPREIVRRFHVGFQIDLLLILKLAVVVFVFNQDGSRDRLFLLLFLAGLVYLYQTGALTPLLQWISQSAQRAMMPPQQPQRGHAPPADVQAREARGNPQDENAAANPPEANAGAAAGQDGVVAAVGEGGTGEAAGNQVQQQAAQGPTWWGFLKEVQMLVVGFVTSLLPGFQHVD